MDYKNDFIEFMVRSNVLTFGDFVTKSGRKTPYFINTGLYRTGEQISKLGNYYAFCIKNSVKEKIDAIYGPAYKGIPLSVTTAISLFHNYNDNLPYCFNRKEQKDHGEGGDIVGYIPKDGDKIVIVEDVITAGTSVRESVEHLRSVANVNITSLIVSVDRLEKGKGNKTTLAELYDAFGIQTYAIVNIVDIIKHLYNREINGRVVINNHVKDQLDEYLAKNCVDL